MVDDLALALIPPLRADDDFNGHASSGGNKNSGGNDPAPEP
jgi:hypothetical protein